MGTLLEVNERLVSALGLYAEVSGLSPTRAHDGVHFFYQLVQRAEIQEAIDISTADTASQNAIPSWVAEVEAAKQNRHSQAPSTSTEAGPSSHFNFQKDKPQVLRTIAETSQAAINLNNALKVRI